MIIFFIIWFSLGLLSIILAHVFIEIPEGKHKTKVAKYPWTLLFLIIHGPLSLWIILSIVKFHTKENKE